MPSMSKKEKAVTKVKLTFSEGKPTEATGKVKKKLIEVRKIKIKSFDLPLLISNNVPDTSLSKVEHEELPVSEIPSKEAEAGLTDLSAAISETSFKELDVDGFNDEEQSSEVNTANETLDPKNFDPNDHFESHLRPPAWWSIILSLVSIFLYFLGYILDVKLLHDYAVNKDWKYFGYTLVCIVVPTLVIQLLSYKMHSDFDDVNRDVKLSHIFCIGPAYR